MNDSQEIGLNYHMCAPTKKTDGSCRDVVGQTYVPLCFETFYSHMIRFVSD